MDIVFDMHCHVDLINPMEKFCSEAQAQDISLLAMTTTPKAYNIELHMLSNYSSVYVALGMHPQLASERKHELTILPATVNNSVNQAMAVSIATMRALEKQIKVLDKQIEQMFSVIPNTLTSVPGIGKVYSAGIIAEIGDVNRFQSQASVAKYAGLVWKKHESGEFVAQNTRLIKSGNRFLRYYLLEAANSVRRCDSEFRRYYGLKYQ